MFSGKISPNSVKKSVKGLDWAEMTDFCPLFEDYSVEGQSEKRYICNV